MNGSLRIVMFVCSMFEFGRGGVSLFGPNGENFRGRMHLLSVGTVYRGVESAEEALVAYFVVMKVSRKRCTALEVSSVEETLSAYFVVMKVSGRRYLRIL